MNLKKLPKEKKNQLILVVVGTLAVMGGLGFGLIKYQYGNLTRLAQRRVAAEHKLERMQEEVKFGDRIETELTADRKVLATTEDDLASGDLYAWVINTIRRFKIGYKVELPQFSPIGPTTDVNFLPNFPYKQAAITVAGTAHFHDFGKFLADFENEFPHIRVLNLRVDATAGPNSAAAVSEDQEMVTFNMEIVTLVKPST